MSSYSSSSPLQPEAYPVTSDEFQTHYVHLNISFCMNSLSKYNIKGKVIHLLSNSGLNKMTKLEAINEYKVRLICMSFMYSFTHFMYLETQSPWKCRNREMSTWILTNHQRTNTVYEYVSEIWRNIINDYQESLNKSMLKYFCWAYWIHPPRRFFV